METTTNYRPGDKVIFTSEAGHIFSALVLGRGDRGMIEVTIYGSGTGCVYPESLSAR